MKLAVATGLFGLGCMLAMQDELVDARQQIDALRTPHVELPLLSDSLALRNRNPLNVKSPANADKWDGQIDIDRQGHAVFISPVYGVRAAAHVLTAYARRHNVSTVEGIITRFAEGNQKEYISYVCKRMGLRPDENFDVVRRLPELLRVMARFESGTEMPDQLFAPYDILAKI